jgi:hypothetical protein
LWKEEVSMMIAIDRESKRRREVRRETGKEATRIGRLI